MHLIADFSNNQKYIARCGGAENMCAYASIAFISNINVLCFSVLLRLLIVLFCFAAFAVTTIAVPNFPLQVLRCGVSHDFVKTGVLM